MAFDYSAGNLLASVRDIVYAGSSQRDWDDTKLLRLINREIDAYLVPMILEARKDHFDTFTDTPLVSGQNNYYLPSKAMGGKIRAVQLVDASGNPYSGLTEYPLESAINFSSNVSSGPIPPGVPTAYWFRGNQLVLFPTPAASPALSLRIYYANRPSTLVLSSACVQISGIAFPTSPTVTYSGTLPSAYVAGGIFYDVVQNGPGNDVLFNQNISSINTGTNTIVFARSSTPSALAIGDWICVTDTAPVVTGAIPDMVIGCLVKKVALEILAAKSDEGAFSRLGTLLAKDEKQAKFFLRRRNEGDHRKVGGNALYRFKRAGPYT